MESCGLVVYRSVSVGLELQFNCRWDLLSFRKLYAGQSRSLARGVWR